MSQKKPVSKRKRKVPAASDVPTDERSACIVPKIVMQQTKMVQSIFQVAPLRGHILMSYLTSPGPADSKPSSTNSEYIFIRNRPSIIMVLANKGNGWCHYKTISFDADPVALSVRPLKKTAGHFECVVATYDGSIWKCDSSSLGDDNICVSVLAEMKVGCSRCVTECSFGTVADGNVVVTTSLLEPLKVHNLDASQDQEPVNVPLNHPSSNVVKTLVLCSQDRSSTHFGSVAPLFAALYGYDLGSAEVYVSVAIQGYRDGSVRWTLLSTNTLPSSDDTGGLLFSVAPDAGGVMDMLPIFDELGENTIGLVVVGQDGSCKIVYYRASSSPALPGGAANKVNKQVCGHHAIVYEWNLRPPIGDISYSTTGVITAACLVANMYIVYVFDGKVLVAAMPSLERDEGSSVVSNDRPVTLPLKRDVCMLVPLATTDFGFLYATAHGRICTFLLPKTFDKLKKYALIGPNDSPGSRVAADVGPEMQVKALLGELSELSEKERVLRNRSLECSRELEFLSNVLHWAADNKRMLDAAAKQPDQSMFDCVVSIDDKLPGMTSPACTISVTLKGEQYFAKLPHPNRWQILVRTTSSPIGLPHSSETRAIFLDRLIAANKRARPMSSLTWRFDIVIPSPEPMSVDVMLYAGLNKSEDDVAENANEETPGMFVRVGTYRLDVFDFMGLLGRNAEEDYNSVSSLTKASNFQISSRDHKQQPHAETVHGPISREGFPTSANLRINFSNRPGVEQNGATTKALAHIMGELLARPCGYTQHLTWSSNKSTGQIEAVGSLGNNRGVNVTASWQKNDEKEVTDITVQIRTNQSIDLPLVREALLTRVKDLEGHTVHSRIHGDPTGVATDKTRAGFEKELLDIDDALQILKREEEKISRKTLSGGSSDEPVDIDAYSRHVNEIACRVRQLYSSSARE